MGRSARERWSDTRFHACRGGRSRTAFSRMAVDGMGDLLDFTFGLRTQLAGTTWTGWAMIEQNIRTLPLTPELQEPYDEMNVLAGDVAGGSLKQHCRERLPDGAGCGHGDQCR